MALKTAEIARFKHQNWTGCLEIVMLYFTWDLKRESKMEGILAEFEGGGHFVLSFLAYA